VNDDDDYDGDDDSDHSKPDVVIHSPTDIELRIEKNAILAEVAALGGFVMINSGKQQIECNSPHLIRIL
jgi:hypothetical protein